jgi:hypothetical protein
MASPTEQDGGIEARLRDLIARGFQFVHPRDAEGELLAVVGVRAHHHVVDVLHLRAEDDVTALRVPGDEKNILEPSTALWRRTGEAVEVLDALLALTDAVPSEQSGAPANGCWVPAGPGRSRWLGATA